jgi:hypothetical protein
MLARSSLPAETQLPTPRVHLHPPLLTKPLLSRFQIPPVHGPAVDTRIQVFIMTQKSRIVYAQHLQDIHNLPQKSGEKTKLLPVFIKWILCVFKIVIVRKATLRLWLSLWRISD